MRKLLVVCGTILCLSMAAAAQDSTAAFDSSSPASEPAAPISFHPSERSTWQLGIGYQYQHFKGLGETFHTNGFNTNVTYYLNDTIGVEAAAVEGYGRTTAAPTFVAKSFFVGGGPRAVHVLGRFEVWVHGLAGWEHFRFTQRSPALGSNSAFGFMGGGGVDYQLFPRAYWRVQADFIGTRFQSSLQSNYSIGTGIVFNF